MILVTGATGNVGRQVVRRLAAAGEPVRALTRHPDQAALPSDVEVAQGDLTEPPCCRPSSRSPAAVRAPSRSGPPSTPTSSAEPFRAAFPANSEVLPRLFAHRPAIPEVSALT
jgi:NAD(P)-dependent dehydrogenase (short-subunit alcohol dehydrogenase family)